MNSWSLEILEYSALKSAVSRFVASAIGKAEVDALAPSPDRDAVEAALTEAAEAVRYRREAETPKTGRPGGAARLSFSSLPDTRQAVGRLRIEGAGLDAVEIRDVVQMLTLAGDVRGSVLEAGREYPKLETLARRIGDFRDLLRRVAGKFNPDGTVADDASPALSRLRREIAKQQKAIQDSLERFLRQHSQEHLLQEDFVTIRNDRFVVPVIAGQQGKVAGVVHGASGSGQTLYVEPIETIQLNNQLVQLREQEAQEVHRILRELTEALRHNAPAIGEAMEVLGHFDFLFGVADFAGHFRCAIPRFSPDDEPRLHLKAARHPLLEEVLRRQKKQVVPISLTLDPHARILLISGPNTGGKSVTLKTAGLLSLMAQSGLPVPAEEAEFPLFDRVLADIGDNQSIEESLSTFSAHIQRVKGILESVSHSSLVLLDELGRATDPEEGGALGIAILEDLRAVGAFALASTHLMALKVYGASTADVVNGSMGFDEETLLPTYQLRLGIPGKSAGLAIAQRLGIPERLIGRAQAAMSRRDADIGRFLSELERRLDEAQAQERQLKERERTVEEREKTWEEKAARREAARLRELEARMEQVLEKFDTNARQTIEGLEQSADRRKFEEQAARRIARQKRELREEFARQVAAGTPGAKPAPAATGVQPGQRVKLRDVSMPVRVLRLLANGIVEVESGFVKLQAPVEDVIEILPEGAPAPKSRLPRGVQLKGAQSEINASRELNLLGKRAEEAVNELERFLDQASLAGIQRLRVVHGHGKGILQKVVAEVLGAHPLVERFRFADSIEGGTGATIVELRD